MKKGWIVLFSLLLIAGCVPQVPGCIELEDGSKILHRIEYKDFDRPLQEI